jgi:hypothetical protein
MAGFMSVPKTAVNEDRRFPLGQHNVRLDLSDP